MYQRCSDRNSVTQVVEVVRSCQSRPVGTIHPSVLTFVSLVCSELMYQYRQKGSIQSQNVQSNALASTAVSVQCDVFSIAALHKNARNTNQSCTN